MPRLGATFKLDDKTVLRAGYGVFYGFLGQRRGDVNTHRLQLEHADDRVARQRADLQETLSNPVPRRHRRAGRRGRRASQTFLGQTISYLRPEPEVAAQSAVAGRHSARAPGRWVADIAYVGNHGSDLPTAAQPQRDCRTST